MASSAPLCPNCRPLALRLPEELCAQLQRLGLKHVADLCALPRAALARRFGAMLMDRLDQALGRLDETMSPLLPPPQCYVRMDFAEPIVQRADIDRALDLLLKRLTEALRPHESGPRKLDFSCYRLDGETQRLSIGTARASLDAGHLFRLFEEKLDQLRPEDGFEAMRLSGREMERLHAQQRDFEAGGAVRHDLAPLIDRLSNRLGEHAVHRFETRESHIPERAVRRLPPLAESPRLHWPKAAQRPVRLLSHPEPIDAVAPIPDDPPVQFRWRHVLHKVRAAEGPERIAPEWWLPGEAGFGDPRLLPRGRRRRPPLLALPRRALPGDPGAALVHAWDVRVMLMRRLSNTPSSQGLALAIHEFA